MTKYGRVRTPAVVMRRRFNTKQPANDTVKIRDIRGDPACRAILRFNQGLGAEIKVKGFRPDDRLCAHVMQANGHADLIAGLPGPARHHKSCVIFVGQRIRARPELHRGSAPSGRATEKSL